MFCVLLNLLTGSKAGAIPKTVHMEDLWKSDFRAVSEKPMLFVLVRLDTDFAAHNVNILQYIFRLPPYYLPAMRRALRTLLPTSILQLINTDVQEPLPLLCMSRTCAQKIKLGEQAAKDGNDWLRGIERNLTQQRLPIASAIMNNTESYDENAQRGSHVPFTHGAYDPCMTVSSYKASLRGMPPPWKNKKLTEENVSDKPVYTDILGGKLISKRFNRFIREVYSHLIKLSWFLHSTSKIMFVAVLRDTQVRYMTCIMVQHYL